MLQYVTILFRSATEYISFPFGYQNATSSLERFTSKEKQGWRLYFCQYISDQFILSLIASQQVFIAKMTSKSSKSFFMKTQLFLLVESLYLNANSGLISITIIVGSSYADKLKRGTKLLSSRRKKNKKWNLNTLKLINILKKLRLD